MASIDPSLISDPREQKWVDEISNILNPQLHIDIIAHRISIFQVPEIITKKKPEAYEPQHLGLGPNHHFRPQPYKKMEQKKLAVVRSVLEHHNIKDFEVTVLEKVRKIVPAVRHCYDMFLQDDDELLAWVLAIDGLFLLSLVHSYKDGIINEDTEHELRLKEESAVEKIFLEDMKKVNDDPSLSSQSRAEMERTEVEKYELAKKEASKPQSQRKHPDVNPKKRLLAQDVIMAENQIPLMVLKEIDEALNQNRIPFLELKEIDGALITSVRNQFSLAVFRTFSEIHSPLELCSESEAPTDAEHLLDYIYHSIIVIPMSKSFPEDSSNKHKRLAPTPQSLQQTVNFFQGIPVNEISRIYEQILTALEAFSQAKIPFPSASKLQDRAGYRFHQLPKDQGVQKTDVKGKDIHLPCVTLSIDSEVTLRNMVAYETLLPDSDSFPLTEYVGLLCALIVDAKDVKLLRKENIIKSDLDDGEVAKLFSGMSSSIPTMKTKEKSMLQQKIEEVKKDYESRFTMKTRDHLKKLAQSLLVVLRAIGVFVGASWKILAS